MRGYIDKIEWEQVSPDKWVSNTGRIIVRVKYDNCSDFFAIYKNEEKYNEDRQYLGANSLEQAKALISCKGMTPRYESRNGDKYGQNHRCWCSSCKESSGWKTEPWIANKCLTQIHGISC